MYSHTFNPQPSMPVSSSFINNIQRAINGEYSAVSCYKALAKMAPTSAAKQQILEIRNDEKKHLEQFKGIYLRLTGSQPTTNITEECPQSYTAGLDAAFRDEQETVDFYLDIAEQTHDPWIKDVFRRAAADEQNHAVWFMYLLQTNKTNWWGKRQNETYGAKAALAAPTLTLPDMLTYALQDEYLAQARYNNILSTFGNIRTFARIKEAELRHISALLPLFQQYQVPIPADNAQAFVTTPASIKAAYAAGVQGEIDNIGMYNKFLATDLTPDARLIFTQLRNASLNHLAAFERGLARN